MLNTEKTVLSPQIAEKIEQLHQDKIRLNKEKIDYFGYLDIDDHGFIYFP